MRGGVLAELAFTAAARNAPASGSGLGGGDVLVLTRHAEQDAIEPVVCYGPKGDCAGS